MARRGATAQNLDQNPDSATAPVAPKPKRKMYKLKIASTRDDKGPVFIGVNGKTYQIQRDVEVSVPEEVVEVLKNSVMTVWEKQEEPNGQLTTIKRDVNRFPHMAMPVNQD